MTPVFAAKRRAEDFDSLVEGTSTRGLQDARNADFLELVSALRATERVEPRSDFVAELRIRLMACADKALCTAPTPSINDRLTVAHRRTARERRIAFAVGGFAIVGATTSMAMAAQSALPGDSLYPLKRAIENAQTGFSVDDNHKGSTLLANATGRLDEVDELSRAGVEGEDAAAITETLNAFTEQASEASTLLMSVYENTGQEASISELRDFTAASMAALYDLQSIVPDEARAALINAAQILTQIDAMAEDACPSCGGAGIREIPSFAVNTGVEDLLASLASSISPADRQGAKTPGKGNGSTVAGSGDDDGDEEPEIVDGAQPPAPTLNPAPNNEPEPPQDNSDEEAVATITDALGGGPGQPTSEPGVLPDLGEVLGGLEDDVANAPLP